MTESNSRPSQSRWIIAAILAGLMILSAMHGAGPHHRGPGPCIACQALTAPALMPPAEVPGRPTEPRWLESFHQADARPDSSAPRLRPPLRAPPRLSVV